MKITAKFASVCPCCSAPIAVGSQVEWSRGAKARHVACTPAVAPVQASAPGSVTRQRSVRRGWRPCGYPGCNSSYCDECDGDGARGSSYGAW